MIVEIIIEIVIEMNSEIIIKITPDPHKIPWVLVRDFGAGGTVFLKSFWDFVYKKGDTAENNSGLVLFDSFSMIFNVFLWFW